MQRKIRILLSNIQKRLDSIGMMQRCTIVGITILSFLTLLIDEILWLWHLHKITIENEGLDFIDTRGITIVGIILVALSYSLTDGISKKAKSFVFASVSIGLASAIYLSWMLWSIIGWLIYDINSTPVHSSRDESITLVEIILSAGDWGLVGSMLLCFIATAWRFFIIGQSIRGRNQEGVGVKS